MPSFQTDSLPAEDRKKLLIVQGELFRAGVIEAQAGLTAGLQPQLLLRHAVSHAVETGGDAARKLFTLDSLLDGRLAMALPLLTKGFGFLSRRHLLRPAAMVLATGAGAWYAWGWLQDRKRRDAEHSPDAVGDAAAAEEREID